MADNPYLVRVQADQREIIESARFLRSASTEVRRIAVQINQAGGGRVRFRADPSFAARGLAAAARRREAGAARAEASLQRVGLEFQRAVVDNVKGGLARPSASTGALAALTGSARNVRAGKTFWGVGVVPTLLADRKVGYALAIEGGSKASVGRRLTGYWQGSGRPVGFGRPTKVQRFVSVQASAAQATLRAAGSRGRVSGIVRRPILAHDDYRDAVRTFDPRGKTLAAIVKAYESR